MNQKTTYELIIRDKLKQLPVPDMADAIWSRIEQQLDIEMPGDSSDPDGGINTPGGGGGSIPVGTLLMVFVGALITIFFLIRQNNNNSESSVPSVSDQPARIPGVVNDAGPPGNNQTQNSSIPLRDNVTGEPGLTPFADSMSMIPFTDVSMKDSVQQDLVSNPLSPPKSDTIPQKPKTKGVTGITDNDYRIVPAKRDSS